MLRKWLRDGEDTRKKIGFLDRTSTVADVNAGNLTVEVECVRTTKAVPEKFSETVEIAFASLRLEKRASEDHHSVPANSNSVPEFPVC